MAKAATHSWVFKARFRARGFGWKSQPAVLRVNEAVREISAVARKNPVLGAEGAVLLLERLSPALEHVDSSSGSIGSAVGRAIAALVPLIAAAPVDTEGRSAWLERLWQAVLDDQMPYLEGLVNSWGELCASRALASAWADRLVGSLRSSWAETPERAPYFTGTGACLSALFHAARYEELIALLTLDRLNFWPNQRWRVKSLAALGELDQALALAESLRGPWTDAHDLAQLCEQILLDSGRVDEAYARYSLEANQGGTFLVTFRRLAERYPRKTPGEVLGDLARRTPGEEGKWFAAAKDAGLYDEALALAGRSPCDPKTLTRASRDHMTTHPAFARDAGLLALRYLVEGYGYEVTGADVLAAWTHTLAAARSLGVVEPTRSAVRAMVVRAGGNPFARQLERYLGE